MRRYYRRRKRYYSNNSGIKSFKDLFILLIQLVVGGILIFISPYVFTFYAYLIQHPILFVPTGISLLVIIGAYFYYIYRRKKIRMRAINKFNEIMQLSSREFEEFIEDMFKRKGFNTILGKGTKDGGVDVTAVLGDKTFIIQCKHYAENNKIGAPMIQQLNGVVVEGTESPGRIFVTTSSFTSDAVFEADKSGMELWDRDYLIKYLTKIESNN